MDMVFATHCGFVRNTAVVCHQDGFDSVASCRSAESFSHPSPETPLPGLGGQIEEVMASINAAGWNHHQVPDAERLPPEERALAADRSGAADGDAQTSGLGGQIGNLAAALNEIGWNHHRVPADERLPPQERG
ncbi:MAG: hypothetical protein WCO00_00110 [Rhodospirillaceae bacterium]